MAVESGEVAYTTEWGPGRIRFCGNEVLGIELPPRRGRLGAVSAAPAKVLRLRDALETYFAGRGPLPAGSGLADRADSRFRRAVYGAVCAIPAGETRTYREIAAAVGRPHAARAVGAALADNRFAPVIPCHRVVGSDGSLRGYGGGLDMKRILLEREGAVS